MEWGRIAGYEYVALTRPGTVAFGVEDMEAKNRFLDNSTESDYTKGLEHELETHLRAIDAARAAQKKLESAGASTSQISQEIAEYERLAETPRQALHAKELGQAFGRLQQAERDYGILSSKLQPLWPTLAKLIDVEEALKVQGAAMKQGIDAGTITETAAESKLGLLKALRTKADQLSETLKGIAQKEHYNLDELGTDAQRLRDLREQTVKLEKELGSAVASVQRANEDTMDQFFIVANALRLGGATEMEDFLATERERQKALAEADRPDLSERDDAMVANVGRFCTSHGRAVALIVGYAHLDGVAAKLKAAGFAVVGGMVAASNDETEPWENRAWESRRGEANPVFALRRVKELSQLLNDTWKNEQLARLKFFSEINLPKVQAGAIRQGTAKLFENVGDPSRKYAVRVGDLPIDKNAQYGGVLAAMGPVPDQPGRVFQAFDRGAEQEKVRKLSNSRWQFAAAYETRAAGQPVKKRVYTSKGEIDLGTFERTPPTAGGGNGEPPVPPEGVVLFGEPDDRDINGRIVSPLHSQLRGRGNGTYKWTMAFGEPPEGSRRGPNLYRTINMDRASERLAILDHQDPLKFGEVDYLDETALASFWFTPRRGDHAQAMVVVGKNVPEFRAALRKMAESGKLRNKQIALFMCQDKDDFAATQEVKETLLREGALMVWVPDRQITPDAAAKLKERVIHLEKTLAPAERPRTIDKLIRRALEEWEREAPGDPDLESFRQVYIWVHVEVHGDPNA